MIDFLREHPWIVIAIVAHGAVLGTVAYLILLERKVASWAQDRLGPIASAPGACCSRSRTDLSSS